MDVILASDFDGFITRKSIQNSYHVDKSWFIMNREFFYDIDDDDNDYGIEICDRKYSWLLIFSFCMQIEMTMKTNPRQNLNRIEFIVLHPISYSKLNSRQI